MTDSNNITAYLYQFTQRFPDKKLLLHPKKISYKKFCALVDSYAGGFNDVGIYKGTKTVVLIKPTIDLFATIFALLRIGAVPVLIDPGMGNKAMAKALSMVSAQAFVGIPKSQLLKYFYKNDFKSIETWISTGFSLIYGGHKLSSFKRKTGKSFELVKMNDNDEVAVFFTSGSTGLAKAVSYKNYMFKAQIELLKNHFKYQPQEIDLCTFPLLGLFSMCLGLSVVLADMDMTHPATLKPSKVIQNINRFGCTFMFCSPMVLKKLAEFGAKHRTVMPTLKKVMTAGAPVSPELLESFSSQISESAEIHTPYGATEALPITDINHNELLEIYKNQPTSSRGICVGYPLKNIDLQIVEITDSCKKNWEQLSICKPGKVGEIVVKGAIVTQNYVNNPAANQLSKIEDSDSDYLWHRMGDLGRIDDLGRIWFYGRKSQRVETKNGTLFTIPTEAVFNRHKKVERSALIGINTGKEIKPVICIQLKRGIRKTADLIEELKQFSTNNGLGGMITDFYFFKDFPVDPRHNAKIYREKLTQWVLKKVK